MNKEIDNILSDLIKLISTTEDQKSNELRYKIGEYLTSCYVNIKDSKKESSNWNDILSTISDSLNKHFKSDGFGLSNLNYMQQFYRKYRNKPEVLNQAYNLDWSHNVALLKDKLNEDERNYYINRALKEKWSVSEINKNIKNGIYDTFLQKIEDLNYKFDIFKVKIQNYKSLVDLEIEPQSKFMVFAGANATGKSNIFEALEFLIHAVITSGSFVFNIFDGEDNVVNFDAQKTAHSKLGISISLTFEGINEETEFGLRYDFHSKRLIKQKTSISKLDDRIVESFSRIFIENSKRAENKIKLHNKLWIDASNLSRILKEVLQNEYKKNEITEWLQILIPEIEKIAIEKDLAGKEELQVYEKSFPDKPITGKLISEGTFNIIALLTLFYQSDSPQFICIEEPEIGLNPAILSELVPFFREMTEKYHHHIWVTTHSTSLVAELTEEELIIVQKKGGNTVLHQCQPGDFEEMQPDEAWMSNMLKGGGLPW